MTTNNNNTAPGHFAGAAKWFSLVNDTLIPVPNRRVKPDVLRIQGSVPAGEILFRDHDSENDDVIHGDGEIDLADGNVFYSEACGCHRDERLKCPAPAKLALAVDDRSAITIRPDQTGKSVRQLFDISHGRNLLRDYESPVDLPIGESDVVRFADGPVFITRPVAEYCINIEGKTYPWKQATITVTQIRELGGLPPDQAVVVEDGEGNERTLGNNEVVQLSECCRVGRAPKYKRG